MNRPYIRHLVTPSLLQLLVCGVLTGIVIIISLREWIVGKLSESASVKPSDFTASFNEYLGGVNSFAESTLGKGLFLLLFILGIGLFGYGLRQTSKSGNSAASLSSDYKLKAGLARLIVFLVLVALIFATIRYTQPLWLSIVSQAISTETSPITIVAITVAVIGSVINYYALWVFTKLTLAK